jgi:translation initiation factor 1
MMTRNNRNFGSVYSTEHGKMCPACGKPSAKCICRQKRTVLKGDGIVRIARQKKGRKGKGVTLITGVCLDHTGLLKLAKQLKQKCGSGGTVKDGIIEIQGDHRDMLMEELRKQDYVVRLSGG